MPTKRPTPSRLDALIKNSIHLQDRTKELYRSCVSEFVAFAGDDPRSYTPGIVEDWLHHLLKTRKPQTVNVYRKAVRYASRRWVKHRTANDPREDFAADADRAKAQPTTPRDPLTYEEAGKLIATCKGDSLIDLRDRAIIILALRSGVRRGGMCSLSLERIKPPKITIINKGGHDFPFVADSETLSALGAWTKRLRANGIREGRVFRVIANGEIGEPMSPFQIWYVFSSRSKRAKIRHVFPHLARHSTVTWLREQGKSAAEVGKLTGQTERTIEDIYTHVRTRGAVGDAMPSLLEPSETP